MWLLAGQKEKVSIRNTTNYFGDFWTGSFCITCITAGLKEEFIKRITELVL